MAEVFKAASMADSLWDPPSVVRPLFEPLTHPLIEMQGSGGTLRFDVREGPVVMGRHEACQYTVSSPRLSRLHACIYSHRGRLWLADLHSQNGTHYQGRPMTAGIPSPLPTDGSSATITLYDQDLSVRTFTA